MLGSQKFLWNFHEKPLSNRSLQVMYCVLEFLRDSDKESFAAGVRGKRIGQVKGL